MEQNSEDWAAWRLKGIGASDAPIIMGKSKYATPHELFLEKTGQAPPKKVNEFITGLGHRFEPRARAYINLMLDAGYQPKVVEMAEYPWLRASLDGFYQAEPLEVKYVGAAKLEAARSGEFDPTHYIQVQHQMMVCGAERCLYLCYTLTSDKKNLDEIYFNYIPYNAVYVQDTLWPELFKFWEKVQAKKWE